MNYRLHTTSLGAWDAMLAAIDRAERSIYLEMYILLPDTGHNYDFVGKLIKKARKGVRVIIVVDAFGSKSLKNGLADELIASGVELIFFSHWLRHIHRKILIVDEKIAFVGGVNIGRRFRRWNDLQLEISGQIVKRIVRSFAYTYAMSGGKDEKILRHRRKNFSSKLRFWLLEHQPIRNIYTLKEHYVRKISSAEESIRIVTPYFTPPRWLISLLDAAIRRGVKVEVIVPRKIDWSFVNLANYRYMHSLDQLGIDFYLSRTMNHSKLLLIDHKEGLVGSQNIDPLSFRFNNEAGIFFKEKKLLQELEQVFENWKHQSVRFAPKRYRMRIGDYFVLILFKIFRPIL